MNYTVIVAEDEELLLNNLVHKIEKADPEFQVIGTAQTGAQALTLVEQLSPDVVSHNHHFKWWFVFDPIRVLCLHA